MSGDGFCWLDDCDSECAGRSDTYELSECAALPNRAYQSGKIDSLEFERAVAAAHLPFPNLQISPEEGGNAGPKHMPLVGHIAGRNICGGEGT
jgi:hypothetical protein